MSNNSVKSFVERIESLETDKRALADDIRDLYEEAKRAGHDVGALKDVVRRRKRDASEQKRHDDNVAQYMLDLGM